jgi:hypothetical protein
VIVATKHLEKMTADFERLKALQEARAAAEMRVWRYIMLRYILTGSAKTRRSAQRG